MRANIRNFAEMTKISDKEYVHEYFLVASHCNAQKELSLSVLAEQIIDVAVEHANRIDIGYARLLTINALWVLSRVTIELRRMPRIEEHYRLVTWIENFHRMFSYRNFTILGEDGEEIGHARTLWVAIDKDTRRPADLTALVEGRELESPRVCPVKQRQKLREITTASDIDHYTFQTTDIDFNRHVNTVRYIELVINRWSLDFYDHNQIRLFDISFRHEAHYGDRAIIRMKREENGALIEIDGENTCVSIAEVRFAKRQ